MRPDENKINEVQVIENNKKSEDEKFMLDLINREELQELEWIAMIKVWPSATNGKIPWDESIISEEFRFTMKQMNRVKKAFDNLMKEVVKAKLENELIKTNELTQMATYGPIMESEEFDPELARKVRRILKQRREEKNREIKKPKKKGIIRKLFGK